MLRGFQSIALDARSEASHPVGSHAAVVCSDEHDISRYMRLQDADAGLHMMRTTDWFRKISGRGALANDVWAEDCWRGFVRGDTETAMPFRGTRRGARLSKCAPCTASVHPVHSVLHPSGSPKLRVATVLASRTSEHPALHQCILCNQCILSWIL